MPKVAASPARLRRRAGGERHALAARLGRDARKVVGEETATAPSIPSRRNVAIVARVFVPVWSSWTASAGDAAAHELVADRLGL
jgi:hypothetical protein